MHFLQFLISDLYVHEAVLQSYGMYFESYHLNWKILVYLIMQFLVKKGHILTPHADYCLPGITRATVSCVYFLFPF